MARKGPYYGNPYTPYLFGEPEKRQVREEFMFGSEPIIAYRVWSVGTDTYDSMQAFLGLLADAHDAGADNPYRYALEQTGRQLLLPIGNPAGGAWKPGAPEARCTAGSHQAPDLDCECGYWALRDEAQLTPVFAAYKRIAAWGTVNLWGRFCEFEKGYRAQYAAPAEITLLRDDKQLADDLERTYGCPVTVGVPPKAVVKAAARHAKEQPQDPSAGVRVATYAQLIQSMRPLMSPPQARQHWWQQP